MADLDQLQIRIAAQDQASAVLCELASNLTALGQSLSSLDTKNLTSLAGGLKKISTTGDLSGITQLKQSIDGLNDISFNTESLKDLSKSMSDVSGLKESLGEADVSNLADGLEEAKENAFELSKLLSEMEFENPEWIPHIPGADGEDDKLKKVSESSKGLVGNLLLLGHEIEKISQGFNKLADAGVAAMKAIYKPMDMVVDEYKEKFTSLLDSMRKLSSGVQAHLKKMSDFWKRSMRTFTFMLVRKAITTFLKEMKDAIGSLAQFESAMGGVFNESMSNAVADLSYIGRALLGAFEPIINVVVPILDTLAAAIARVMALIGHFFAALTGQGYFVTAKKNVQDFTASLDKAGKSQKNLTMGIDELNILNENNGGGASASNPMDEWDLNEVEGWMKDFADKFKAIWEKFFNPLKEAWNNAKDYITSGFKYMVDELGKLLKRLGEDFLTVWNEPETIRILTQIFKIIGDIERVIGHIAKNFREAWEEGEKGLAILRNIRDIIGILVDHLRNVTTYMVAWAASLDFNPILEAFVKLTESLKPLADFIGGLFEDIMERGILRYVKWWLEEGAPHTLETIAEIIDAFNFDKIRGDFQILIDAVEQMFEHIHTGVTNAMGNVGKALAEWMNSEEFTKFMESIARILDLITAERVEKLFTALGTAILEVGKSLASFVSSDIFQGFIDKLVEWYDSKSAEDIANILTGIATAIAAFKFTAFVGEGLAGFFQFLVMVKSAQNISSILSAIGGGASAAAGGLTELAGAALPITGIIAGVAAAMYSFVESFGGVEGALNRLKAAFDFVKDSLSQFADKLNIGEKIEELKQKFDSMLEGLGNMKAAWDVVLNLFTVIADILGHGIVIAFGVVIDVISEVIDIVKDFIDMVGGLGTALMGLVHGDMTQFSDGVKRMVTGVVNAFKDMFEFCTKPVKDLVDGVIKFFADLKYKLVGDPIVIDMWNDVGTAFSKGVTAAIGFVGDLVTGVITKFTEIKNAVGEKAGEIVSKASEKFSELKEKAGEKFGETKENLSTKAGEIVANVSSKWDALKDAVGEKFSTVKENGVAKFEEIKSALQEKAEAIKEGVTNTWTDLGTKAAEKFDGIKSSIEEKISGIEQMVEDRFNALKDTLENKVSDMFSSVNIEGQLQSLSTALADFTSNVLVAWTNDWQQTWDAIREITNVSGQAIRDVIVYLLTEITELLREFEYTLAGNNALVEIVTRMAESIKAIVTEQSVMVIQILTMQAQTVLTLFDQMTAVSDTKFRAMATKIVTAFTTMRDGTITAITGMAEMLTAKYIEIEVATQTFVETINMMFLDMTTGVADRITEFTTVLVDRFNDMTERVCQTVDRMRERLIDRYDDMKNRLSETMERIDQDQQRKWEHITDTVERQNEKIKDRIEKSWENNKKVIEDKMQKIKESVEKNFEQIAQKVENKCEKIKQKIDKLGERLEKFASENLPNWADAWRGTWEDIKGVVSSACAEILDMVQEMVAEVEAAFAGLKYGLVGDPIVIDMWDDIEDAFGKGSDNSLAEVEDLAENVADSFMDMADDITESPMFTGLVDSAAKSMDGVINVVDGALENVKSLFDTELSFPKVDAEMPQFNVNPDMGMPQTSFAENEAAMNNVISSMKSQMDGATTDDAIKNEIAQQSDQEQRLFNTMIDLLQDLVKKDTNVYMDSRSMVSTLNNRSRRNGYDFRMA